MLGVGISLGLQFTVEFGMLAVAICLNFFIMLDATLGSVWGCELYKLFAAVKDIL